MMSLRSWLLLLFFYVIYLLLGGFAFQAFECQESSQFNKTEEKEESDFRRQYYAYFYNKMKEKLRLQNNATDTECDRWNLYNSVFFSFTVMTTIGFGHLAPETWEGKLFCIFYSLLGIPINGILIGSLGNFFGSKLPKFKRKDPEGSNDVKKIIVLMFQIFGYIIPGFLVFMLIPAVVFWHIEDAWTYLDCLYFSFVTLTTIGFGDYVPGRDIKVLQKLGGWKVVYETGLIIWILFGLGYIFMIVGIITDGISTPARKAAKKLAEAEKIMIEKIIRELIMLRKAKVAESNESASRSSVLPDRLVSEKGDMPDYFVFPKEQKLWPSKSSLGEFYQPQTHASKHVFEYPNSLRSDDDRTAVQIDEMKEDQENDEGQEDLMNHDTITSLHNFMQTAKLFHRSLQTIPSKAGIVDLLKDDDATLSNTSEVNLSSEDVNLADRSPSSNAISRMRHPFRKVGKSSDKNSHEALSFIGSPTRAETFSPGTWNNFKQPKSSRKSHSQEAIGHRPSSISSSGLGGHLGHHQSLAELLRSTTLEEFLEAVEKVEADEEQLITSDDSLKAAPGDHQHSSEMKPSRKSSSWLHVTPVRAHGDSTHEHHPLRDQLHRLHHHHPHQDHELSSEFKSSKNSFHWLHITPVRTTPNSKLSKNDDYQNKIN